MSEVEAPKPSRRRTVMRSLRMSQEEHDLFEGFCAAQGVTASEALRRLARGAALLGPTFADEDRALIVAMTRQLRGIGTNLNQALHHINAGGVVRGEDLAAYLNGVREAIGELDQAYRSLCARTHRRAVTAVGEPAA
jgi:hypothetical protein